MEILSELRWSPYVTGIGIGVLSWLSFFISGKPLATSTSFAQTSGMFERLFRGSIVNEKPYYKKIKLTIGWQWMLVIGIIAGSFLSAVLSGDFSWTWVPSLWASAFGDTPVLRLIVSVAGGICLGFGARFAGGCTSGHGISGTLQLAVSSWISAVFFFVGGIITAYFIYYVIT